MENALTVYGQFDNMQRAAVALYESGYFGDAKSKAQAIVKVMAGAELGLPPFASMTGIHIIQGKPALGANVIATLIKNDPRYNYRVLEHTDSVCRIQFFEGGGPCGISEFTAADAKKAGTKNMDKFPKNMLFARAISNGAKWYTPGIFGGAPVYTPDELGADVDEDGNVVDGTYTEVPAAPPAAPELPTAYASQRYVLDDIKNHILEDVVKAILTDCTDYKHERHVLNAIAHYPFDDKQSAAIESGKFKLDAGQKISKTFALALYDWLVARKEAPEADSNAVQEAMFESQENGAYAE